MVGKVVDPSLTGTPKASSNTLEGDGSAAESIDSLPKWAQEKFTSLETDRTKLQRDLSSTKGQIQSQKLRDAGIEDSIAGLTKALSAVAKAQEAGTAEGLGTTVDNLTTEAATAAAGRRLEARYASLYTDLTEAVEGVLDLNDAPELSEVRSLWKQGTDGNSLPAGDRMDLWSQAITLAHKVARTKERTATQAVKKEEDIDAFHTDSGGGASGGSTSMESLLATDTKSMTLTEKAEFQLKLWKKMKQEDNFHYPGH